MKAIDAFDDAETLPEPEGRRLKLMQFYGAKTRLLEDIMDCINPLYQSRQIVTLIDVFGGSGTVLLNVPPDWRVNRVYNDLDKRLYTLMLAR